MIASTEAPYGAWRSPLTAADVAAGSHRPIEAAYVGGEVWWTEPVAAERRVGLFHAGADGDADPEPLLAAPWNVRSTVHEYGGGAWAAAGDGAVFVQLDTQRLHLLPRAGADSVPLTPLDPRVRYGGLRTAGDRVLAVQEVHTGDGPGDVERALVAVPLDGSAADDPAAVVRLVGGSRFVAQPALSPGGRRLAWIAWDHPNMPWDGTELRVGDLEDGTVRSWRTVLGGPDESVLQPEWLDDGELAAITDRSGWWNLVRVPADGGDPAPLHPAERETGGPLWDLGQRWFLPLPDGRVLLTSTLGADEQRLLDPGSGTTTTLRAHRSRTDWHDVQGGRALLTDDAADEPGGLRELDLATGVVRTVRAASAPLPPGIAPVAELRTLDGVHAVVYPPRNDGFRAPEGERPPYVALVHGGPTAHAAPAQSPALAYLTSRGIGVVDVNHRGSTGYGRAYRAALDGRWGVVDVEDVLTVLEGLADAGEADAARLAVEGGSAGGWTVLSALMSSDLLAAGVSRYGVTDAVALLEDTHDFEARYLDRLIGPYPEAADVYAARAPINRVDALRVPVLLLQGLDDRVVPPAQSRVLRDALVAHRVPHALIEFEGEGHGFRGRDTQVRAREAALSFLGQVLGFDPPDVPVLTLWRPDGEDPSADAGSDLDAGPASGARPASGSRPASDDHDDRSERTPA